MWPAARRLRPPRRGRCCRRAPAAGDERDAVLDAIDRGVLGEAGNDVGERLGRQHLFGRAQQFVGSEGGEGVDVQDVRRVARLHPGADDVVDLLHETTSRAMDTSGLAASKSAIRPSQYGWVLSLYWATMRLSSPLAPPPVPSLGASVSPGSVLAASCRSGRTSLGRGSGGRGGGIGVVGRIVVIATRGHGQRECGGEQGLGSLHVSSPGASSCTKLQDDRQRSPNVAGVNSNLADSVNSNQLHASTRPPPATTTTTATASTPKRHDRGEVRPASHRHVRRSRRRQRLPRSRPARSGATPSTRRATASSEDRRDRRAVLCAFGSGSGADVRCSRALARLCF